MKIITATFKGKDGSMGFRTGISYQLIVIKLLKGRFAVYNSSKSCVYESIISFLNNWEKIS